VSLEDLDKLSDKEIMEIQMNTKHIITTKTEPVNILGPTLVCKNANINQAEDEIAAINFAHSIGIKVPTIRRLIPAAGADIILPVIIMDRIHGQTLEQLWSMLGWWNTVLLALQFRRYISAMHSVKTQIGGGLATGLFHSQFIEAQYGPI
jgi:hypothetical protein